VVATVRIAVGSDQATPVTEAVVAWLEEAGFTPVLCGALANVEAEWAEVAETVARQVARGGCDFGVLSCWTGTGVAIAANKVPGVRAALCVDAATATGARAWNDANVLCLSLRLTTEALAAEILDAWFEAVFDESERPSLERVARLDAR